MANTQDDTKTRHGARSALRYRSSASVNGRSLGAPVLCLLAAVFWASLPTTALAYVGPGGGLTAIGAFLAAVAAIFVAILGFLWYPIKRILRRRSGDRTAAATSDDEGSS